MTSQITHKRIEVADALRGMAVVGIILFHSVESFDAFDEQSLLTLPCDKAVYNIASLLLSGKMYGIFALLFGLTFYLMSQKMSNVRFLWRMVLLFIIGLINIAIYDGDILTTYAICGMLMIPFSWLSNKWLWVVTVFILIQPYELWQLLCNREMPSDWIWKTYAMLCRHHQESGFWQNLTLNLRYALPANLGYFALTGRLTQNLGLFLLGMLFGRYRLFCEEGHHLKIWKGILAICLPLAVIGSSIDLARYAHWLNPMVNLMIMMSEIAAIVLLWYLSTFFRNLFTSVCSLGRMSLSNYLLQSFLGCFFFYGWGMALYRMLNHTYAILIGVLIVIIQLLITRLWAHNHQRGPAESLWRAATYMSFKNNM